MRASYPVEWVRATPEYILACFQEEWRQCALTDAEAQLPTFATTIKEWREALDLVWWSPLGQALNKEWGTRFSESQWFSVLVPAGTRTLRDVCTLLSTEAKRPVVKPARILGRDCPSAGVFLAIRSLLIQAGASPNLRPSSPLEPYLKKWPKIFLKEVSRLVPGGLPFESENKGFQKVVFRSFVFGCLLLALTVVYKEPWVIIAGVILYAVGWFGGLFGGTWFPETLKLGNVHTFRGLTELIIQQQRHTNP